MCKILGLFVDTLTADDRYSLLNRDQWNQFRCNYLRDKKETNS